ncbi:MAG: nucleotidyl transferase AbiEii/AbiGii toxin family protein [Bacteroidota bacterium]
MYPSILNQDRHDLLPLIKSFIRSYYLVGETAIGLQIGHRESIDFDLFTDGKINIGSIKATIRKKGFSVQRLIHEDNDQMHLIINDVKLTFFNYIYPVVATESFDGIIKMPNLLDLAAMKAFALGRRAKWKDYVDLYFLFKEHVTIQQVSKRAYELFDGSFNGRLFREQLAYYKGIDYSEEVVYMPNFQVSDEEVKSFLTKVSISKI